MRPSKRVAGAALAVLALGALPGLVGSSEPNRDRPIDAVAFRPVDLASSRDRLGDRGLGLDAAGRSEGALEPGSAISEPDGGPGGLGTPARPLADAQPSWAWMPPKDTIQGEASFYDNGTTAMRLPRGTVVVICGAGGCIERTINDYGPSAKGGRVIDLYRPDFFRICGCPSWSGTTQVTIRIY
jgi:hypothetical protein